MPKSVTYVSGINCHPFFRKGTGTACTLQQCCHVQTVFGPEAPVYAGYQIHFSAKQLANDRASFERCSGSAAALQTLIAVRANARATLDLGERLVADDSQRLVPLRMPFRLPGRFRRLYFALSGSRTNCETFQRTVPV